MLPFRPVPNRTARFARRLGFTLIEVMVVVCIIEVIIAIAIPGLVNARETGRARGCSRNLRSIQGGLQQYAIDKKLAGSASEATTWQADLIGPTKYIKATPICGSGGTYTVTTIDTDPTCTGDRPGTRYRHTLTGN